MRNAAAGAGSWKFWMVLVLVPVNWGLETRKWQLMLKGLCRLSFFQAFKAILAGVAFSLNTPNRIGEYGGRILFIPEGKRIRAVSLTMASGFSQLLVTMLMGSAGLFLLSGKIIASFGLSSYAVWFTAFKTLIVVFTVGAVMTYFRIGWLVRLMEKIPGAATYIRPVTVLEDLTAITLVRALTYSFGRYLVFIVQYKLMLDLMQVELNWWQGVWSISVLFLLLAAIPTIALLELGLRWEYSIILFGMFSSNLVGMYAAASGIWFVNLVLPAISGSLFILGVKVFSSDNKQSG